MTTDNVCASGGAEGADRKWGEEAERRGDAVMHFVFRGHRSSCRPEYLHVLTNEQMAEADEHLARANIVLRRRWPVKSYFVASLLRRNFYQVRWSDSLYAISSFEKDGKVAGGTAWAVVMFTQLHPDRPCFVYDQFEEQWYRWVGMWVPVMEPDAPEGVYAAIGTRELNEAGERAIESLMRRNQSSGLDNELSNSSV